MSDAPTQNDNSQPDSEEPYRGRTGQGVSSVLPFLHKQTRTKIPVPLDELELPPERQGHERGPSGS